MKYCNHFQDRHVTFADLKNYLRRNDYLKTYTDEENQIVKENLGITDDKEELKHRDGVVWLDWKGDFTLTVQTVPVKDRHTGTIISYTKDYQSYLKRYIGTDTFEWGNQENWEDIVTDVYDELNSDSAKMALSANQGRILYVKIQEVDTSNPVQKVSPTSTFEAAIATIPNSKRFRGKIVVMEGNDSIKSDIRQFQAYNIEDNSWNNINNWISLVPTQNINELNENHQPVTSSAVSRYVKANYVKKTELDIIESTISKYYNLGDINNRGTLTNNQLALLYSACETDSMPIYIRKINNVDFYKKGSSYTFNDFVNARVDTTNDQIILSKVVPINFHLNFEDENGNNILVDNESLINNTPILLSFEIIVNMSTAEITCHMCKYEPHIYKLDPYESNFEELSASLFKDCIVTSVPDEFTNIYDDGEYYYVYCENGKGHVYTCNDDINIHGMHYKWDGNNFVLYKVDPLKVPTHNQQYPMAEVAGFNVTVSPSYVWDNVSENSTVLKKYFPICDGTFYSWSNELNYTAANTINIEPLNDGTKNALVTINSSKSDLPSDFSTFESQVLADNLLNKLNSR